jgi:hypothetical protein
LDVVMTDRTTLLALAERCEQAAGPDRALDAEILCAIHGFTIHKDSNPANGYFAFWEGEPEKSRCVNSSSWDRLTGSLDAAVTLVPEGYYWQAANGKRRHSEPQACADLFVAHGPNRGDMSFTADAATPALALCAAALRARAAML